jgi:hypothetical protein
MNSVGRPIMASSISIKPASTWTPRRLFAKAWEATATT